MRTLTYPSPQQEEALRGQAPLLRAAYASFPKVPSEPQKPSTWHYFKRLVEIFAIETPPLEFDWRDHVDVPPAKYQGTCNSCTSFAAAATIEIATVIANGGNAPDVAAQHMHTCVVHRETGNRDEICNNGIEPRRLLKLLQEFGYAISLSDAAPFPSQSCSTIDIHSTLQDFSLVATSDARSSITKGPIITDMYVWDDFFDYTTNRAPIYSPDMSLGQPMLHSVCVVGYTSNGWTIKNSLGSGWGDGSGFATIKKGACGLLTNTPPQGWAQRPAYAVKI
jgi:C1A family cysteine protease